MTENDFHSKYSYKRTKEKNCEYLDISITIPSITSDPIVSKDNDERYLKYYWTEQLDKAKAFYFEGDYNIKLGQVYSLSSVQNMLGPLYILGSYTLFKWYTRGQIIKTNPLLANLKLRLKGSLKVFLFPVLPLVLIGNFLFNAQIDRLYNYQLQDLLGLSDKEEKEYETYANFVIKYENLFKNFN